MIYYLFYLLYSSIILLNKMGNVILNDQLDQSNATQLKLIIDLNKPASIQLTQLLNWSLGEIRDIYAPFRKRKSSPILTRSQFLRLVRLSRISAFHIYDQISKIDVINAFQLMAILVLTSYTTYTYKIQFLFSVFDLLSIKILKFSDLILMFKSVVRGFAFLTGQQSPDIQTLQKYAQTIFSKADLNNDQNLSLAQVLGWAQQNKDVVSLFKAFQPKIYGKEQYHIFNCFSPYKEQEIQIILYRIKKSHHGQKMQNEDYQLLKIQHKLPKASMKENIFMMTSLQLSDKIDNRSKFSRNSLKKENQKENQSILFKSTASYIKLPQFSKFTMKGTLNTLDQQPRKLSQKIKKNKFNNIIIIKGRTITKREIFDLQDYFDKLSDGKDYILIQDFINSFSQEKYNHMKSVAASLYNFLDHDQNGKVTFKKLLLKIYPNLAGQHIQIIDSWCRQYNENFNIKSKIKVNHQSEQTKKRVLPKACMTRFKEMFQFYDKDRKGYIDIDDMRKVLSEVCTQKQIFELFEDSDRDGDGKISLFQFSNLILPMDLQIQGLQ